MEFRPKLLLIRAEELYKIVNVNQDEPALFQHVTYCVRIIIIIFIIRPIITSSELFLDFFLGCFSALTFPFLLSHGCSG